MNEKLCKLIANYLDENPYKASNLCSIIEQHFELKEKRPSEFWIEFLCDGVIRCWNYPPNIGLPNNTKEIIRVREVKDE